MIKNGQKWPKVALKNVLFHDLSSIILSSSGASINNKQLCTVRITQDKLVNLRASAVGSGTLDFFGFGTLILHLDIIGRKKAKFALTFAKPPTFINLDVEKQTYIDT